VVVDVNAAGHGWFIDATPSDDKEFSNKSGDELRATSSSPAYGRIDLLTVVMHEVGHLLGFTHDDPAAGAVMDDMLSTGVRRLPPAGAVAPAGTESVSGGSETQQVSFNSSSQDSGSVEGSATQEAPPETTADSSDAGATTDESQPVSGTEQTTGGSTETELVSDTTDATSTAVEEPAQPASTETTPVEEENALAETSSGDSTAESETTASSSETVSEPEPVAAAPGSNGKGRKKA